MAAYRETNRAQARAYNRDYYAQHPEVFAAKYQENRDELIARKRAARAANPGSETENSRRWRREHPEQWALRNRENQRRRRARDEDPVDYAAILAEHGMVCHICGGEIASLADLHMEHVIPLARGGRHHRNNIRPAHALCNLRKGVSI